MRKVLEVPDNTWVALERLAKISSNDSVGDLMRDALRIYEWIVYRQSRGESIVSVSNSNSIMSSPDVSVIPNLFETEQLDAVKKFFDSPLEASEAEPEKEHLFFNHIRETIAAFRRTYSK